MVQHLNGMFAFAVWDGRHRSIFIARDRVGKKPLYYTTNGNRFLFASELKALLCDPTVKRDIDLTALLANLSCSHEEAYFRDMSMFLPETKQAMSSPELKRKLNGYTPAHHFAPHFRKVRHCDILSRIQYVDHT